MVIAKPMLVTMVSAVPFWDGGALRATRVEKSGESEITTIPQKRRNAKNQDAFSQVNAQGRIRQQIPDRIKDRVATFFSPNLLERYPPKIQAGPPTPIIKKAQSEMGKSGWGCHWR
jgi:hypothetical protein